MTQNNLFGFDGPVKPARISAKKLSKKAKAERVSPADIDLVFQTWRRWCKTSNLGPPPNLSDERKILIGVGIHDFGLESCLLAVEGCSFSAWHMGENPDGKRYDDIELILRDAKRIERFVQLALNERPGLDNRPGGK